MHPPDGEGTTVRLTSGNADSIVPVLRPELILVNDGANGSAYFFYPSPSGPRELMDEKARLELTLLTEDASLSIRRLQALLDPDAADRASLIDELADVARELSKTSTKLAALSCLIEEQD
jgi:hypothetical protein